MAAQRVAEPSDHLRPRKSRYYSHFDKHQPDLKTTYERERENAPRLAEQLEITLLDNASCVLEDGTRVLGTTLWTDFLNRPPYMSHQDAVREAMRMNDYRCIKVGEGRSKDLFKPRDSIAAHKFAVKWLTAELAKPHDDGDTIVVSHHQPMPTPGKPIEHLDHCYSSASLGHLFEGENVPTLWIHGHVHRNADHMIGNTRVLANPRGYPMSFMKNAPRENPHFDPEMVIEIGRKLTPTWRL
jgi:hypothetical protein